VSCRVETVLSHPKLDILYRYIQTQMQNREKSLYRESHYSLAIVPLLCVCVCSMPVTRFMVGDGLSCDSCDRSQVSKYVPVYTCMDR